MNGPTKPPRFPTELISPIEAAAADSVRNSVGTGQNAGWKPKYAPPTPMKKSIASKTLEPMWIAMKRKDPLSRRGIAACHRRSCVRSECHPLSRLELRDTSMRVYRVVGIARTEHLQELQEAHLPSER